MVRHSFTGTLPLLLATAYTLLPAAAHGQRSLASLPLTDTPPLLFAATVAPSTAALSSSSLDASAAESGLPEAPLPQLAKDPKPAPGSSASEHIAPKSALAIPSDWHAQRLTAQDKVKAGFRDLYSVESVASWFLASGYEQVTNGSPNYGTDKGAYGERLGAAALRGTSQNVFSEIVLPPLLHEDIRYYVEGSKYNFFHRVVYAGTRTLVAHTDSGKRALNGSVLLGYAGAAALTPTYYPQINRNFTDVARTYGSGLGGAALGYLVTEFSQDFFRAFHLTAAR